MHCDITHRVFTRDLRKNHMKPIAIEAALITEHAGGLATLAVNNELMEPLSPAERDQLIRSMLVLSRNKLLKDLDQVTGHERIRISPDKSHKSFVMQLRVLVTPEGRFSLLTYFGGQADPKTRLHDGLQHALQVVAVCENNGE